MNRTKTPAQIAAAARIVARYEAEGGRDSIVVNHWVARGEDTKTETATWVRVR